MRNTGEQLVLEGVDVAAGDVLNRGALAEAGQQVMPYDVAVVGERGALPLPVVFEVAEPLVAGVLERAMTRREVHQRVITGKDRL